MTSEPNEKDDDLPATAPAPEADKLKGAWVGSASVQQPLDDEEPDVDTDIADYMADEWEAELADELMPGEPPATPPPASAKPKIRSNLAKRLSLPLIVIGIFFTVIIGILQIPAFAKARLESKLHAGGFPLAQIGKVDLSPAAIHAENIKLDQYGFDEIKILQADVNWLSFLATGEISGLSVNGIHLGRDATNIGPDLRSLTGNLLLLPDYRISIANAIVDITTDFGELRVTMEATVNPDEQTGNRVINARVISSQFQLGFDSTWNGTLAEDGSLDLSAEVVDGRLNIGPMRVSRYNGWIGLSLSGGNYTLDSQMEAGSATFMDVPLNNISLVTSHAKNQTNMILRSGVSGMPDVLFTSDLLKSETDQTFSAIIAGNNLGMLLDYIEEATGRPKEIRPELVDFGRFRFAMDFESGKRFVGGPLPFALALTSAGKQVMQGNILVYPDTLDVRGSLETDNALALAFQDYFKIPSTNMRQNFIRLDGDMRRFFYFGDTTANTSGTAAAETSTHTPTQ